jgi:leader peptidase (prepilin peptidase)/N-methyltransferase
MSEVAVEELGIEGIYPDDDDAWLPWILSPVPAALTGAGALAAGLTGWITNAHRGLFVAALVAVLCAGLVIVSVIDFRFMLLPDAFTLPAIPLLAAGVLTAAGAGNVTWAQAGTAFVCMAGCYAILWILAAVTNGFAWGDVKLAASLGLVLGLESPYAAALGCLILPVLVAGLAAVPLFIAGRGKTRFPFGPFMAVGAMLVLLIPGWLPTLWMNSGA